MDSIVEWGNAASFCSNTAVLLENDFSILPSVFHAVAYAFINMSNCVMEVNDGAGFRNCCLEITLTYNPESVHQPCHSLFQACAEE